MTAVDRFVRFLASIALFPVLIVSSVVATVALLPKVGSALTAVVVWTSVFVALIVAEQVVPRRPGWRRPDGQLFHDFGHAALGSGLGSELGALLVTMLTVSSAGDITQPIALDSVLGVVVVGIAYLVIDLCRYLQHRLTHDVSWLWALHTLHHDPRRLIALKAGRSHLLDRALQALCVVPALMLGLSTHMIAICVLLNSLVGLIAHANLDLRLGPLSWIVVGPATHRVHHATGKNLGASLLVWDQLFGTFEAPGNPAHDDVGVAFDTPTSFAAQLAWPVMVWLGYEDDGRTVVAEAPQVTREAPVDVNARAL